MMRNRKLVFLLITLTVVNVFIFIFKDHFQYQPYATPSTLYGSCNTGCERKWNGFPNDYPENELRLAKQLTDSVIGSQPVSTIGKVRKFGSFLVQRFQGQLGKPSQETLTASPLQQYYQLTDHSALQLWCGNYAQIFAYFCWSQGIVCRIIEIMKPGDHHIVNECYIPEIRTWVLCDLTNNNILVRDQKFNWLNFVSFRENLKAGKDMLASQSVDDTLRTVVINKQLSVLDHYFLAEDEVYYYHRMSVPQVYSSGNKLRRYFLPVSWYDILDFSDRNNLRFYLKLVFALLWLATFFVFIRKGAKFKL